MFQKPGLFDIIIEVGLLSEHNACFNLSAPQGGDFTKADGYVMILAAEVGLPFASPGRGDFSLAWRTV
jgi:hypothetical protein